MSQSQSNSPNSFAGGAFGGPPVTVNLQQMSDLVAAVTNSVRALGNVVQALQGAIGPTGFSAPVRLAGYTGATLPAVTLTSVGQIAFVINGRAKTAEGAGAGTGCTVQVQNIGGTATWCAIWSGIAVTV